MSSKYSYQEIKEIIKVFDNESSDLFFFSFNIKKKKKKNKCLIQLCFLYFILWGKMTILDIKLQYEYYQLCKQDIEKWS